MYVLKVQYITLALGSAQLPLGKTWGIRARGLGRAKSESIAITA